MAITASTLFSRVRSLLDDDNSNRYNEADDLVPAINSAISYLTAVFSAAFEQKQIQPEVLSELTQILIYDKTSYGTVARINLNEPADGNSIVFNDLVWLIIGLDPYPMVIADAFISTQSRFAKRMTLEEWNYSLEDPFIPGTSQDVPSTFSRACYLGPGNYYLDGDPYILMRPGTSEPPYDGFDEAGVWVLKKHPDIASGSTELLFPVTIHNLIEQKMLQFITYQNANDLLFKITDKEVKELIQLMN